MALTVVDPENEVYLETLKHELTTFDDRFQASYDFYMSKKLGLKTVQPEDRELIADFLELCHNSQADFTCAFRYLSDLCDPSQKQYSF